jgi:hypothetical protein
MLTDKTIRAISGTGKIQKFADGGGLTLVVTPAGTKTWWVRYRFDGKEKTLTVGQYPTVTLANARDAMFAAKKPSCPTRRNWPTSAMAEDLAVSGRGE